MAVRVGFEPTEPVKVQRFSRPPDSTALAPHRIGGPRRMARGSDVPSLYQRRRAAVRSSLLIPHGILDHRLARAWLRSPFPDRLPRGRRGADSRGAWFAEPRARRRGFDLRHGARRHADVPPGPVHGLVAARFAVPAVA